MLWGRQKVCRSLLLAECRGVPEPWIVDSATSVCMSARIGESQAKL